MTQLASATLASATAATAAAAAYTAAAIAAAAFAAVSAFTGAPAGGGGGEGALMMPARAPIVKAPGFHRNGLDVVPRDGYRAILHKNEAVLNASDAHTWRGMQNGAIAAPSRSSRDSAGQSVMNNSNNVTIGTIILPNVREPKDFAPALNATVSRRTQQQQANDFVSPGGSRR